MSVIGIVLTVASVIGGNVDEPFAELSFEEALERARETERIVFVDFFTTWCGPCKKLDRVTWKDAKVRAWLSEKTVPLKIDAEQERELAQRYGIKAYPSLVFVRPDGSELDRIVGYVGPEDFLTAAKDLLAGRTPVDRLREELEAVDGKDVSLRMDLARELARRGQPEEALEHFLWCWDHGLEHQPSFVGVRGSFLVGDLSKLAQSLPAAEAALRSRRDGYREKLLAGAGTPQLANDLATLDKCLGESEATLEVYDTLPPASETTAPGALMTARGALFRHVVDRLLTAKRYEDVVQGYGDPEAGIRRAIVQFEEVVAMEGSRGQEAKAMIEYFRRNTITQGAKPYEALLGLGRTAEAEGIADLLLEFEPSYGTFRTLVKQAVRAGATDAAAALVERARPELSEKEIKRLERSAKPRPQKTKATKR